jgi:glycosyltransferase involved in cell wall biosynthesis
MRRHRLDEDTRRGSTTTPRVSVVIPTWNEAKNLPHVFALLPDDVHEVILVDGRSVDDTIAVARALRSDVRVVLQNRKGKGNAMACGFAAATGDIVVMLDADGSADPREIPRFVEALVAGADFAKGSRFTNGGGSADITRVREWGNRWLNRTANFLFGTRYTDLCYGYNAFWAHCLPALNLDASDRDSDERLWGDGFEIETIINTRIAKARMRIVEVPSFEFERIHGQSHLNTWRDGFRVVRALMVERVNRVGTEAAVRPLPLPPAQVPQAIPVARAGESAPVNTVAQPNTVLQPNTVAQPDVLAPVGLAAVETRTA